MVIRFKEEEPYYEFDRSKKFDSEITIEGCFGEFSLGSPSLIGKQANSDIRIGTEIFDLDDRVWDISPKHFYSHKQLCLISTRFHDQTIKLEKWVKLILMNYFANLAYFKENGEFISEDKHTLISYINDLKILSRNGVEAHFVVPVKRNLYKLKKKKRKKRRK